MIQVSITELWAFLAILIAGCAFIGWIIASLAYHGGRVSGYKAGFSKGRHERLQAVNQKIKGD